MNDNDTLRDVNRILGREIDMLTTALIAHGKDKHHIVGDHVDRVVCSLARLHDQVKQTLTGD